MRKLRIIFLAAIAFGVGATICFWVWRRETLSPISNGIVVASDTTRLLGPLRADGTVDYAAALNAEFSKDVTPENNAAVILLKISGTGYLDDQRQAVVEALGLRSTAKEPGCWNPWKGFGGRNDDSPEDRDRFYAAESAPWSAAALPAIDTWLKSNEQAFRLAEEASKRERYWFPVVVAEGKSLPLAITPESNYFISMALRIRAMEKIGAGDMDGALSDLRIIQRLACLGTRNTWIFNFTEGER